MQTVTDHIREHLLVNAGVVKKKRTVMMPLKELKKTQWSSEFEQLMRNRLIMGAFRYEPFSNKKSLYPTATEAIRRILRYLDTGNTEDLVDAANMLLLEFVFGKHPKKHFKSLDDAEHCKKL